MVGREEHRLGLPRPGGATLSFSTAGEAATWCVAAEGCATWRDRSAARRFIDPRSGDERHRIQPVRHLAGSVVRDRIAALSLWTATRRPPSVAPQQR